VKRLRVAVLASGTGSLLQAILDGQDDHYEVALVVTDRPGVKAIERAQAAGVEVLVFDFKDFASREEFSEAIARAEGERGIDLAIQAGFMRILSPIYFRTLGVPSMNSHPALLPSFPGAHGVREAMEWGVKITGTTIHFVDEEVDHGPIILQEAVVVEESDTEEMLHERIKAVEQRLYPEAIRLFAEGRLEVEGRRVRRL